MIILPYGENALLVNFEQKIDESVNARVIRLHQALQNTAGIHYTIPAYASLTVGFDSEQVPADELRELIYSINLPNKKVGTEGNRYVIPVCYEGDFAPDMKEVSGLTGLEKSEIISKHTGTSYRVFMLGFIAGFAYLGSLPPALQCPRKQSPRKRVPQGAVGLAGFQIGIYPTDAPGGWQLIGQTPIKTFDPKAEVPVKLQPGDQVQFRAISMAEYDDIKDSIAFGTYEWEVHHG